MAAIVALLAIVAILLLVVWRQRRQLAVLAAESRHDPLTGLPNRRALKRHWAAMPATPGLILIDLVGFKAVNDHHGHIVGDALLRQVAGRLDAAVAPPGLLCRWGGDEFAALVPADALPPLPRRLQQALAHPFDLSASGGPAHVIISARTGLASGGNSLAAAEQAAAKALLSAKNPSP